MDADVAHLVGRAAVKCVHTAGGTLVGWFQIEDKGLKSISLKHIAEDLLTDWGCVALVLYQPVADVMVKTCKHLLKQRGKLKER